MPRLPDNFDVRPTPVSRRGIAAVDTTAEGRGLATIGVASQQIAQNMFQVIDENELAYATSNFAREKIRIESEFEQDQDYATFAPRYDKQIHEALGKASSGISNGRNRSLFESRMGIHIATGTATINKLAHAKEGDFSIARANEENAKDIQMALHSNDPDTQALLLGAIKTRNRYLADREFISHAEAERLSRVAGVDFQTRWITMQPTGVQLETIQIGDDGLPTLQQPGMIDHVPRDVLAKIVNNANTKITAEARQRIIDLERLDRISDRKRTEAQEEKAIELRVAINEGQMTEADIQTALNNREITLSQHNALLNIIRDETNRDIPHVVAALDLAISESMVGKFEVGQEYVKGLMSNDTYSRLINKVDQVAKSGGILARDDVKRGRSVIDDVVGGVRGPLAILDTAASERLSNAVREYDERVLEAAEERKKALAAGKALPSFDPLEIADSVVARFRVTAPTVTSLPAPLFLVGPRTNPDVKATKKATLAALDRGDITPQQAADEISNLDAIQEAQKSRVKKEQR